MSLRQSSYVAGIVFISAVAYYAGLGAQGPESLCPEGTVTTLDEPLPAEPPPDADGSMGSSAAGLLTQQHVDQNAGNAGSDRLPAPSADALEVPVGLTHHADAMHSPAFESLLSLVKQTATLDDGALEQLANGQAQLLQDLEKSPQLIDGLLAVYPDFSSDAEKQLVRTLLASAQDPAVEAYAMEQVESGNDHSASDWLALLHQKGIHESTTRDDMVAALPQFTDPANLRSAILALTPGIVSIDEREAVVAELNSYVAHADEHVRSAAVEAVTRWGDPQNAHVIEEALFDASPLVRRAALFAASASPVRSDNIKTSLLQIMNDSGEDWPLRMDAYSALSSYGLEGGDYEDLYEFDQERKAVYDEGEARG